LEKRAPVELSGQGVIFNNDGEEFYTVKSVISKWQMLAEATKKRAKRADEIAKARVAEWVN